MTNVADADATVTITLSYDREGERLLSPPKQVPVLVSPVLAQTVARAVAFNRSDPTPLSFTSLLVGMLTGKDAITLWLKNEFTLQGVPVERIASRRHEYDQAQLNSFEKSSPALPTIPLATSVSARRAVEEGQRIAASIESESVLDLRHVVAAFPVLREWHEQDFIDLGIDRLAWCRDFGTYMASEHATEKWYWRSYADRAAPVPLTSFSADVYTEKDLLGIDRSVEALALLMASTRTDTPLSIGVFGPWGSGKSFFMRHLRRRIWSLAEREQTRVAAWRDKRENGKATADDAPLYYGQVAQVEFNAWHYNEGNLVASLVDHLFRNLRVLPGPKDKELEARQKDVLVKITGAQADLQVAVQQINQAENEVKAARDDVQRAKDEVASVRQVIDTKAAELKTWTDDAMRARDQLDAAIRDLTVESNAIDPGGVIDLALLPLSESPVIKEVRDASSAIAGAFTDWKKFALRLFSPLGLAAAALLVTAPLVVKLTHVFSDTWAAVTAAATAMTATLAPVIKLIHERRGQFETKMAEIEQQQADRREQHRKNLVEKRDDVRRQWEKRLASLQTSLENQRTVLKERETTASAAVRTLVDRTSELDKRVHHRADAEMKLRELEADLTRLSSALLLDEFIKDRASTDEYRKQLSFLALVRRDFERLSDLIAAANDEWCAPDKNTEPPLLNRIVLYIDDLDRCSVKTVLKVLEVVHLLLAFPLFVCVVAVDPRWIEKCLQQKNDIFEIEKGSNEETAHVTVGDYLEKIFQIPIWMKPIEGRQRATVVKSLLGITAAPVPKAADAKRYDGNEPLLGPDPPPDQPITADGFQAAVNKALERPDPLRITPDEALFVDRIGELLSDKPRALKRFVNTYRLLKASLSEIDQKSFVTDEPSSPHKVCITQLAFFTGQPRLAPALVSHFERSDSVNAVENSGMNSISDWFSALPNVKGSPLAKAFTLIPDSSQMTLECFREWLPETSKYLFHRNE